MDGIPKFVEGLNRFLDDKELRTRLGKEGRKWVSENHNKSHFVKVFYELCGQVGVG
ncbi:MULTISPECIES: glycosyltransferase [unclassified Coleofasciculus]|uniref:glycosyltransferase n=1 Tax=unclassified Coleofasciculus TaxID=2692782 RepID=UPI001D13577F|nr:MULTISPECIES: hypothetical protein [unclassified Coleofasciculus]